MINRYSREKMQKIWDLEAKFNYYLKVELAVCEAYAQLGKIPNNALEQIKEKAVYCLNCQTKPCAIKGCPIQTQIPEFITEIKKDRRAVFFMITLPKRCR